MTPLTDVHGVGPAMALVLNAHGITCAEDLAAAKTGDLLSVTGIGQATAPRLIAAAQVALGPVVAQSTSPAGAPLPNDPEPAAKKKASAKSGKAAKKAKAKKDSKADKTSKSKSKAKSDKKRVAKARETKPPRKRLRKTNPKPTRASRSPPRLTR